MAYDMYSAWFHSALARQLRPRGHCRIIITHGNSQYVVPERNIKSVSMKTTGDPLSRRLPTETLEFNLLDYDNLFNPDNPSGYAGWFNAVCSCSVEFGLEKDNGTVEYGQTYTYYIQKPPSWKKHLATFKGTKLLGMLTMPFRSFTGILVVGAANSLEGLYKKVLGDAGISHTYDGGSILAGFTINTSQSLPEMTVADALLQIAVASGGVVQSDEQQAPYVGIQFYDFDVVRNPSVIWQKDMLEFPVSETIPLIANEKIRRYDYGNDSNNDRETVLDYSETFADTSEKTMYFVFSKPILPGSTQRTVTGATITAIGFSRTGVDISFVPDSTSAPVTIKIEAKPLSPSVSDSAVLVNQSGTEDESVDCRLINSATFERIVAFRGDYLTDTRKSYKINYRGDPSIDVYDVMRIELPFVGVVPCIVLETDFSFDGSFHGRLLVRVNDSAEYDNMSSICGIATAGDAVCGTNST